MRVLPLMALVLLAGLAIALVARGEDGGADARAERIELRTAFEARRWTGWTSLAEETRFLRRLDARSRRVTISRIGRSVQGRPIRLIRVGPPRTRRQIAAGRSVLFTCSQHADEPAGREACLQAARDYANSAVGITVLIIPTVNPDGVEVARRHNAEGVDINRDHHRLATPEARAVAAVIRDYKPDLLGDMHEFPWSDTKVLVGAPNALHRNVAPEVSRAVDTMTGSHVLPALERAGFATGYYPSSGGEHDESVLRQQAALRHVPALLLETSAGGALTPRQRVRAQRTAISAIVTMARRRAQALAATTGGAARRALAEGAAGDERYFFSSPSSFSDAPPCGYRLTAEQYRSARRTLDLQGIAATPDGGGWTVSTAQAAQPVIGLLLDGRAPRELTAGRPVPC